MLLLFHWEELSHYSTENQSDSDLTTFVFYSSHFHCFPSYFRGHVEGMDNDNGIIKNNKSELLHIPQRATCPHLDGRPQAP